MATNFVVKWQTPLIRRTYIRMCRLQLQPVVVSHVLLCLGLTWCPGPGHRLTNLASLSMVQEPCRNRLPSALPLPEL